MKDDKDYKILIIILLAAFALYLIVLDGLMANENTVQGTVLAKSFDPERVNTFSTTTMNHDGTIVQSSGFTYQYDQFSIVVKNDKDTFTTLKTTPEHFSNLNIGDTVNYSESKGFFTGLVWTEKLITD